MVSAWYAVRDNKEFNEDVNNPNIINDNKLKWSHFIPAGIYLDFYQNHVL